MGKITNEGEALAAVRNRGMLFSGIYKILLYAVFSTFNYFCINSLNTSKLETKLLQSPILLMLTVFQTHHSSE